MIEQQVVQKKLEALCARHLHEKRLASLKVKSFRVDILAFAVPTAYVPVRLLSKGTEYGVYVEGLWALTAGLLATASIIKMVSRWQDKAEKHSKLIGENISLVTQANHLLSDSAGLNQDRAHLFFILSDTLEKSDRDALGVVPDTDRQEAYRQGLKELVPYSTETCCPYCNASPWRYTPGECQACGNTPVVKDKGKSNEQSS